MARKALITGVTGQDGYYLSKLLVSKGYEVVGHTRHRDRVSQDLIDLSVSIASFDLRSISAWDDFLADHRPDEIYHLAGVSFVPTSWSSPFETLNANLEVTLNLLESIRRASSSPSLFYACSSEVFGEPSDSPQNELTPFRPLNPYGVTKAASFSMIESYRRKYGVRACSGILFNHESPRRDPTFVTRKITKAVAAIRMGLQDRLFLGNLDVSRDWGSAEDYVACMHATLQADEVQDFVIGSGRLTSLERVVETAFSIVGMDWRDWVSIDPSFVRPHDAKTLVADSSKALEVLDWAATTTIEQVIAMMVKHDLSLLERPMKAAA